MTDSNGSIHPDTRIGTIHLTVKDLDRSLEFYQGVLGLHALERKEDWVSLKPASAQDSIGKVILTLHGNLKARLARRTTGLYHFAILMPSRQDLARALLHLIKTGWQVQGFADHGVSEAIYLADPEGNGIEIYRDRPKAEWPVRDGRLWMGSEPLDIDDLLNEIRGEKGSLEGMPAGTIIGHIHLRVASIPEAERFYCDVLGFELMQRYGPSAGFVSAGGYHHHIGYNTWESDGAPPPPPDAIGLRFFSVLLPDEGALRKAVSRIRQAGWPQEERPEGVLLHDPSGNTLLLENSG